MVEKSEYFLEQLKRHEGFSLEAYLDSVGVLTVGYGHNCEARPVEGVEREGDVISRRKAGELLAEDVGLISSELDRGLPWWRELEEPRQGVVLNMAYNMGMPKLKGFVRMLHSLELGDWSGAAREMLDSRWAEQVKGRSAELATQMVLGEWQEG